MDTKTAILDHSETVIKSDGLNGFSIAKVSESVGIQKSSLFHHFHSKSELLEAVLDRYLKRTMKSTDKMLKSASSAAEKLSLYVLASREAVLDKDSICLSIVLCVSKGSVEDRIKTKLLGFQDTNISWLRSIFELGQKDGTIETTDPHSDAILTLAVIDGAQIISKAHNDLSFYDVATEQLKNKIRSSPARM